MAVEALMNELRPDKADDVLRRSIRAGCGKAVEAVEQLRDALDGLDHVRFGASPPGTPGSGETARSLAARLRDDARPRRITQLAGRFRRIAGGKRRWRVRHGADEIVDIEQGADLGRLLPLEMAQLVDPRTRLLTLRNMVELLCLQYRLECTETLGEGPRVVAIDKSGSMEGDKDIWATAVALALLDVAQHEKRPFALLCFDGAVKHESIVLPGAALPEAALFVPADGGTDIDKAVRRGLEIFEKLEHRAALLDERRAARNLKGRDRIRAIVPEFDRIVERWDVAGSSLGYRVARAIKLLDLYGDQVFAAAAADVIARGLSDVGALAVACEKHRKELGRHVPIALTLPDHLDDADVVPHDLESYDDE